MSHFLVAVINGTKARLLTLEPVELPEYESGPHLMEQEGLLSAAKETPGQELWSSAKTGRNRGVAGHAHSYDDHRENHMLEFERRFAQTIANKIVELADTSQVQQLLLIAEPQILGLMRESLMPILPKHLKISELAKDLCHLQAKELHEYLAKKELLPAYNRVPRV